MINEPTKADLDQMNKRVRQLRAEGFPDTEAITEAFEEMRGSRRAVDDLGDSFKLTLLRAPDDEPHHGPGFQQEIRDIDSALKANGVKSDAHWLAQDAEDAWCGYVGVFVIALPVVKAVKDVVIAYLKRRTGRKVQVEFDGLKMKVEEPSTEQVDRLLNLIEEKSRQKHTKK